MQATTHYEFERPEGWNGESVNMQAYVGAVDYFELEVEASVIIEIDENYGADADGNRGCRADFSYIEDITIILDGDFRPFWRKTRDLIRKWSVFPLGVYEWESQKDNGPFRFKGLGDEILTDTELASIEESLFEAVEGYDPNYDERY
jgi:hypothetical protein